MRVALDVTSLLDARTGVGTFTDELARGLARRPDIDLRAFAISLRGRARLGDVVPAGVRHEARPFPARAARALWRRADVPDARLLAGPADVVHGPNFVVPPGGGAAELVTIHDLTALHYPQMCTPDVLEWPGLLRRALSRGAWVHTVSEHVAAEVREAFPEAGERVVAVRNGVHRPPPPGPATSGEAGATLAGGERYVVAVGTEDPRKDLPGLVRAFEQVAAADPTLRLVLAGGRGMASDELDEVVERSALRSRIVRLGRIDDDQRLALLRGAAVVAYPSRYEGFGLVPLEAMAVGTPVVTTSVGAIAEVVGDAAVLVAPGDVEALANGLGRALGDDELRAQLVVAGDQRVDALPWRATVEGIAGLYRRIVSPRSR